MTVTADVLFHVLQILLQIDQTEMPRFSLAHQHEFPIQDHTYSLWPGGVFAASSVRHCVNSHQESDAHVVQTPGSVDTSR